jgi:hypothetical protein
LKKIYRAKDLLTPVKLSQEFLKIYHEINENNPQGAEKKLIQSYDKLLTLHYKKLHEEERNLSQEVREWVYSSSGKFHSSTIDHFLQLSTLNEKKNLSTILSRLCVEGVIEREGKEHGCFRRVEKEIELIRWWKSPLEEVKLRWVFGLEDLVEIYPGNIIVVAGLYNAGKSAMVFDFIKRNVDRFQIDVFNSEAGGSELRKRITKMNIANKDKKKWLPPEEGGNLSIWERSSDFDDVIKPKGINVIDFLEEHEEFYKMGAYIKRIHDKLAGGIALIMIQKDVNREFGRGGIGTLEKPRLYLALDHGIMKIVKAKNWKGEENPNGLITHFKLYDGWQFSDAHWHEYDPVLCPDCEKVEKKRKRNNNK